MVVLPVGHLLGPFFTDSDDEFPASVDVRLGDELSSLPSDGYLVWAAAHGDPREVATTPMTKAGTLARIDTDVSGSERAYRELVSAGLLVEVAGGKRAWRAFAENHRVLPLALGLGNSVEQPDRFVVGTVGAPTVEMPASVFSVWMFGHQHPSLWQACQNVAMESAGVASRNGGVDPALVLDDVVALLPLLVSTGCACVDRRIDV